MSYSITVGMCGSISKILHTSKERERERERMRMKIENHYTCTVDLKNPHLHLCELWQEFTGISSIFSLLCSEELYPYYTLPYSSVTLLMDILASS